MGSNRTLVEPGEAQYYAAMARIEKYEAVIFEMVRLLEHATHTTDVERAKAVGEKALEGTRYDRSRHIRS
jgi:hypothetical protein